MTDLLLGEDVEFLRDGHCYRDADGTRVMSVTQAIAIEGLIDFSMVPRPVMDAAKARGSQTHHGCAVIDRGDSLDDFEIPEHIMRRLEAYMLFLREMRFIPNPELVERPMIVPMFGARVAMTPDSVGTIDGIPTLIERKTSTSPHVAWRLQTAGYTLGLQAAGYQIRQRIALQLFDTGRYKCIPHEDRGDFDSFGDCFRMAAFKLKHKLVELD